MNPQESESVRRFMCDGIEMKKCVDELLERVEQIYGLFRDSIQGWHRMSELFNGLMRQEMAKGLTREQALKSKIIHGEGDPSEGKALHVSTLGQRLAACASAGQNEIILSNLCLIAIYSFWEDQARKCIAHSLGINADSVQSDLFGDIAKMRNAVLHADGIMDKRARSLKVLKWFAPGDRVLIDRGKLDQIIVLIRQFPHGLRTPGYDPTKKREPS